MYGIPGIQEKEHGQYLAISDIAIFNMYILKLVYQITCNRLYITQAYKIFSVFLVESLIYTKGDPVNSKIHVHALIPALSVSETTYQWSRTDSPSVYTCTCNIFVT